MRLLIISLIAILLGAIIGLNVFAQWQNPTAAPPSGNPPAPINVGPDTQTKSGGLNIMGNVGIGTTTPQYKLDVVGGITRTQGGLIIETRTSDPGSPVTGQIWLRTDI
jgi:hypothetical protein